jgi:hypothetical protein
MTMTMMMTTAAAATTMTMIAATTGKVATKMRTVILPFPLVGLYAFLHPEGPSRNIKPLAAWPNPTNADPLCHADLEGFEDWRLDNDMVAEQQDELEYDSGDEFGIEEQVLPSLFPGTFLPRASILASQS